MVKLFSRLVVCGAMAAGAALASTAVASADVAAPFQVNPAPYGNPNGSFDLPAVHCVAVVGAEPGVVTVTDGTGAGCYPVSEVRWLNVSTGASGAAPMTGREFTAQTGAGQIALVAIPAYGSVAPGFATIYAP